ncbi:MAG: 16S rRNA processing protein RimM [Clostridia bacterium]|nr:16S rRNA processing protein RimM [Clostridia bacterium]
MYIFFAQTFGDLPEGKYYIADLIGADVYEDNGKFLGTVDDVFNTKSNSVYVVRMENGELKYLPGIPEVIKEVDITDHKITVTLIKGL